MTSALLATLEVTDMRYSMSHYIAFLADVPQRLGRSKVLDTAVKAVTVCFPSLYTGERTPEMLTSFGHALTCLRMSIEAPDKQASAETLSGMYLIAVCQVSRPPYCHTSGQLKCVPGLVGIGSSQTHRSRSGIGPDPECFSRPI